MTPATSFVPELNTKPDKNDLDSITRIKIKMGYSPILPPTWYILVYEYITFPVFRVACASSPWVKSPSYSSGRGSTLFINK